MVLNFLKSSYQKVKTAFSKTGSLLGNKIRSLFGSGASLNQDTLEELEKIFYEADLGVETTLEMTAKVKKLYAENPKLTGDELLECIRQELLQLLTPKELQKAVSLTQPYTIMVVGVNGNGKTTSTAKLAKKYQDEGKKVLLAAADTFRAAAMEQLSLWASKLEVDIVKGTSKSDPAAVVFDAMNAAKARNSDILIIDTAGRLHTKIPLMQELEKIKRSCKKFIPEAPHETLLVLDATTGQNAIEQAKAFHQFTPITGLVLTKIDGTAKGGIIVAIQRKLGIPVKYIGVGESIDDLEPFDAETYINALLG